MVSDQRIFRKKLFLFMGVTKWCRHFSEGRTDVHDEQGTGRPSMISDALLQRTEEAIRTNRRLRLKEMHQINP
ncbi:hypothetical protein TNCV_4257081 [Trichonephila clavipes]|nr:hypothetical protein TNCV_4257081 [Trichonephila clavipes]